jgi:hypothetical protein
MIVRVGGAGFHKVLLLKLVFALSPGTESNTNPQEKEDGAGRHSGRAGGTGLHRVTRDSSASECWRDLCGTAVKQAFALKPPEPCMPLA